MASVAEALTELGIKEWVLRGEPTNESGFNSMFRKVTGADANGTAIESSNAADFGTTWAEVDQVVKALTAAEPMKALRIERNRRIAETDWNALSDVTMSAEMTTYRQALRDITATYSSLEDVVWPTKP